MMTYKDEGRDVGWFKVSEKVLKGQRGRRSKGEHLFGRLWGRLDT